MDKECDIVYVDEPEIGPRHPLLQKGNILLKVTVCELPNEAKALETAGSELGEAIRLRKLSTLRTD